MPRPIRPCCSWRASSASGPRAAKKSSWRPSARWSSKRLERWKLQKEAQIEQMMRDGVPLGAVAAALASPETAERIAVLEAATSGGMSPIDAARLTVRRAGGDLQLLDGLRGESKALAHIEERRQRGGAVGPFRTEPPRLVVMAVPSALVPSQRMTEEELTRYSGETARQGFPSQASSSQGRASAVRSPSPRGPSSLPVAHFRGSRAGGGGQGRSGAEWNAAERSALHP